jgi:hypothetical protein
MSELKYIIFKDEKTEEEFPILFPKNIWHDQMSKAVIHAASWSEPRVRVTPVSAGFAWIGEEGDGSLHVVTHGKSESMNLSARPSEDYQVIQRFLKTE